MIIVITLNIGIHLINNPNILSNNNDNGRVDIIVMETDSKHCLEAFEIQNLEIIQKSIIIIKYNQILIIKRKILQLLSLN